MNRLAIAGLVVLALAGCGPFGAKQKAKELAGPLPPLPAWAGPYMYQPLSAAFTAQTGNCVGNAERVVRRYAGPPAGAMVAGWGWDTAGKRRIERVILVDPTQRIVGAGEGGLVRADVPRGRPDIADPQTGWRGVTSQLWGGVEAYGLVDGGRAVCPLGHVGL
jgi:hypothetical protein